MTRVELFEAIRRDHFVRGKSIRGIARDRGIHRRMVRDALRSAVPPARKRPVREPPVLTPAMRVVIDAWLEADRTAPRKQRHTGRRIFRRLQAEHGYSGAESTLRRYVGRRRRELAMGKHVFVPLSHEPGREAEVDWYEAEVEIGGRRQTVQFFQMRACFSGREFHMAFPCATQQAFLEGHVAAFAYFGGVFDTVRYDNLTSAVKRVMRGRRREETDRFVTLRSHYLFDAEFCLPGKDGAHEKGGVEGGVGRFRRNHLVPVPAVEDFESLNRLLLDACATDDLRRIEGRTATIAEDWEQERPRLRGLPDEPLQTAEVATPRVDSMARIKVRTNRYSVPVRLAHRRVECRVHAHRVEVLHEGRVVATHERLHGRHGERLELDHYLELLWHKPGALERSRPLRQARERKRWPDGYDQLWAALRERFDDAEAARQMLAVLMLHREHDAESVFAGVDQALVHGCYDAGAVAVLVRRLASPQHERPPVAELGELARYDRPVMGLDDYDRLLTRPAGVGVH